MEYAVVETYFTVVDPGEMEEQREKCERMINRRNLRGGRGTVASSVGNTTIAVNCHYGKLNQSSASIYAGPNAA